MSNQIRSGILPNNLVALIFNADGTPVFTESMEDVLQLRIDTEKKLWGCKENENDYNFEMLSMGEICKKSLLSRKGVICVYDRLDIGHLNLLRSHFAEIESRT